MKLEQYFTYECITKIFVYNNQHLDAEMYHRCKYVRLCALQKRTCRLE